MTAWLHRDPRAFALALMVIVVAGVSATLSSGRQEDPTLTNLFATVLTPYPGADAARVEALVTTPLEDELLGVSEIAVLESVSRTGLSMLRIELEDTLSAARIDTAWTEIRAALDDAARGFPDGVAPPEFTNDRMGAFTLIVALEPSGARSAPLVIARLAEALADRLRAVPGAALVETFGAATEEVAVTVDPEVLADLGLTAGDVAAVLARADAKAPAGRVRGAAHDLAVEVAGAFDGLSRLRAVPLTTGPDGRILRLGDVARIERAAADPPESLALLDGRPAVLVAVRAETGLRVDAWAARARAVVDDAARGLPASVSSRIVFDQARYTTARFAALGRDLATGMALVTAILVLTLGLRAALVVAAVLPLTAMTALVALQLMGVPIHQMSVTGMIVALGLLVDAAIVMTVAIKARVAAGEGRAAAVSRSVSVLATPLLVSTLTTVLAFLPMALLPGPVGDFIGSIALAVIAMLSASLILALTVTPAMAGFLLPDAPETRAGSARRRWWRDGAPGGWPARAFDRSLALAIRNPALAVIVSLAAPVAGVVAFPSLTAQFFPGADRDQFHVQMTLAPGAALSRTTAVVARADALLRGEPGVASVVWTIGGSAPSVWYNMIMDQDGVGRFAEALVTTRSPAATEALLVPVQRALDRALPEAQSIVRGFAQGPPVAAPVELRLVGPDLEVLRDLGDRVRRAMADVPAITHARATASGGAARLVFHLDEDLARLSGLDPARVAATLSAGLDGVTGGAVVEGDRALPVRVRLGAERRGSVERVFQLTAPAAPGAARGHPAMPLAALGDLRIEHAAAPIHRRQGERVTLVQGFVAAGVLPEEALRDLRQRLGPVTDALPSGYRIEIGGDAGARADTVRDMLGVAGLVIAATVATLVLGLGSFRLAVVTLTVAPLSAGLSLLALAVAGHPFGINALMGVVGAMGVAVNAAIIVLSALRSDPRARVGEPEAVRRVVHGAGRHIVSTTATTVGGFLPLLLSGGGFWPPFAMAMTGGVLLSTAISLYFTPAAFLLAISARGGREAAAGAVWRTQTRPASASATTRRAAPGA